MYSSSAARSAAMIGSLVIAIAGTHAAAAAAQTSSVDWAAQPRVQRLVGQMTLDEKLSFVSGVTDPAGARRGGVRPGRRAAGDSAVAADRRSGGRAAARQDGLDRAADAGRAGVDVRRRAGRQVRRGARPRHARVGPGRGAGADDEHHPRAPGRPQLRDLQRGPAAQRRAWPRTRSRASRARARSRRSSTSRRTTRRPTASAVNVNVDEQTLREIELPALPGGGRRRRRRGDVLLQLGQRRCTAARTTSC